MMTECCLLYCMARMVFVCFNKKGLDFSLTARNIGFTIMLQKHFTVKDGLHYLSLLFIELGGWFLCLCLEVYCFGPDSHLTILHNVSIWSTLIMLRTRHLCITNCMPISLEVVGSLQTSQSPKNMPFLIWILSVSMLVSSIVWILILVGVKVWKVFPLNMYSVYLITDHRFNCRLLLTDHDLFCTSLLFEVRWCYLAVCVDWYVKHEAITM